MKLKMKLASINIRTIYIYIIYIRYIYGQWQQDMISYHKMVQNVFIMCFSMLKMHENSKEIRNIATV